MVTSPVNAITIAMLCAGVFFIQIFSSSNAKIATGEIAGYINIIAYFPYFISIVRGETKPSKSTWWIWAALELMMSTNYYLFTKTQSTIWLPIASFIGMFMTAILSVKYGKKEWPIVNTICLLGSVIGIVVWIVSKDNFITLTCLLLVDILASVPMFIKSYEYPQEEDFFSWLITLSSGIVNLFAIETWNVSVAILPMYNLAIYAIVVAILMHARLNKALSE